MMALRSLEPRRIYRSVMWTEDGEEQAEEQCRAECSSQGRPKGSRGKLVELARLRCLILYRSSSPDC